MVERVDEKASKKRGRAYGGIIRTRKGKLQEGITEEIIKTAWENIGGRESRLSVNSKKFEIPIKEDYVLRIRNEEARNHILANMTDEPTHKPEFFKPLTETSIKKAIDLLSDDLKQYC